VDLLYLRLERPSRSVSRKEREPQAGPASCLSNSASKVSKAGGESVMMAEPKTDTTAQGEGVEGLPGSKSVARAQGGTWNEGGPGSPCRTNCESQAGTEAQRQGAPPDDPGVGLVHSIQWQGQKPGNWRRDQQVNAAHTGNQRRKNDGTRLANLPAGTAEKASQTGCLARGRSPKGVCESELA
jgi:hypothetical protein